MSPLIRELRATLGDRANFIERYTDLMVLLTNPEHRRGIVERLIESVEILPAKHRGGNIFDPHRVVIHWRRPLPELPEPSFITGYSELAKRGWPNMERTEVMAEERKEHAAV